MAEPHERERCESDAAADDADLSRGNEAGGVRASGGEREVTSKKCAVSSPNGSDMKGGTTIQKMVIAAVSFIGGSCGVGGGGGKVAAVRWKLGAAETNKCVIKHCNCVVFFSDQREAATISRDQWIRARESMR